ncbi:hypothetical protein F5B21DRAFT_327807 [Xylaria acuta]|nr:hypothetical protein F5B21DRAFT_327807 [Xylaria acuta]
MMNYAAHEKLVIPCLSPAACLRGVAVRVNEASSMACVIGSSSSYLLGVCMYFSTLRRPWLHVYLPKLTLSDHLPCRYLLHDFMICTMTMITTILRYYSARITCLCSFPISLSPSLRHEVYRSQDLVRHDKNN